MRERDVDKIVTELRERMCMRCPNVIQCHESCEDCEEFLETLEAYGIEF